MFSVNIVYEVIKFVFLSHIVQVRVCANRQIKQGLRKYILVFLDLESHTQVFARLKQIKTFIEGHSFSARTVSSVLLISNCEVFLEFFNAVSCDLCISLFVLTDLIIFSVCHLNKLSPLGTNPIDKLLVFRFNLIFVHFKHSELFLRLNNFELHIHGSVLDLSNDVE